MEEIKLQKCTVAKAMKEAKVNIKNNKDVVVSFINKENDCEVKITVQNIPPEVKIDENGEKWMKVRV